MRGEGRTQDRDGRELRQAPAPARRPRDSRRGALHLLDGHVRHRQRIRLRSVLGEVRRAGNFTYLPFGRLWMGQPPLDFELHLQSYWKFRGERGGGMQVAVYGWSACAISAAPLRLSGRRRWMGAAALLGTDRALG